MLLPRLSLNVGHAQVIGTVLWKIQPVRANPAPVSEQCSPAKQTLKPGPCGPASVSTAHRTLSQVEKVLRDTVGDPIRRRFHRLLRQVGVACPGLHLRMRKRAHHRTAKNYQLDLFDPDDGYY